MGKRYKDETDRGVNHTGACEDHLGPGHPAWNMQLKSTRLSVFKELHTAGQRQAREVRVGERQTRAKTEAAGPEEVQAPRKRLPGRAVPGRGLPLASCQCVSAISTQGLPLPFPRQIASPSTPVWRKGDILVVS